MTTIAIVVFDGVTDIDVFLHWDLLNRPRTAYPQANRNWHVKLLGTKRQHATAAGLQLTMHGPVEEARQADAVLVSSGPTTRLLMQDHDYLDRLALDSRHQLVAGQCSGSLILAAAGILGGLAATTYPTARADLENFGARFVDKPLVAHKRVATAAGCLAGAKLDYWLMEKLLGAETAAACVDSAQAWGGGLERQHETAVEAAEAAA